jgi:mannose-6-phosphate isomerase-like protein (cupin superfamily)
LDSSRLVAAINSKRVQYFPEAFTYLPQWPEFVHHINASKLRGDLDLRRKFYMRAPITQQDLIQHFMKLETLRGLLQQQLHQPVRTLNAYINLAIDEEVWPAHADEEDSLFIQCEGSVTWYLEEGTFTLRPGDAIYFPGGTMHEVHALTPRASVIFAID